MRPVLLTAGATRNPVDAIRYLSAHATGRTSLELARLLHPRTIHLLGSAEACLRAPPDVATEEYFGTRDLMARMETWLRAHPRSALVHAAAVGDYEMAEVSRGKIASGHDEVVLRLVPAPKIVDRVRDWAPDVFLVSFKAGRPGLSAEELEDVARAQLRRTRSDHVFANVIGELASSAMIVGEHETRRFAARADAIAALATLIPA